MSKFNMEALKNWDEEGGDKVDEVGEGEGKENIASNNYIWCLFFFLHEKGNMINYQKEFQNSQFQQKSVIRL